MRRGHGGRRRRLQLLLLLLLLLLCRTHLHATTVRLTSSFTYSLTVW